MTLQVLLSIDTTGSMNSVADEVRIKARELGTRIFKDCPGAEIAVIFHGDYCDEFETYTIKTLGFTNDVSTFEHFVKNTGKTYGGDADECYELVLHTARAIGWKPDTRKLMVMIGDADPHSVSYPHNKKKLEWKREAALLRAESSVEIIAVQCLSNSNGRFWQEIASVTCGKHLRLNQFRNVQDYVLGAVFQAQDSALLDRYEAELQKRGVYTRELQASYATLRGKKITVSKKNLDLIPVSPSRFQVLDVPGAHKDSKLRVDDFITAKGIPFKRGRAFYPHVTRTEKIQHHKEIVLEDLATGDMFTGPKVRELIGLPLHGDVSLKPHPLAGFRCWIQSTSDNRYLRDPIMMYDLE